jgi:ketosteroid isomerase-like protein
MQPKTAEKDDPMTSAESTNLTVVRAYLSALEAGASGETLACFFTADAVQIELPNKLHPYGGHSDLTAILSRAEQGAKLLRRQRYEVRSELAHGSRVAVEVIWTGVLAVEFGALAKGTTMRADCAIFFELVGGRIALQRNYDCFELVDAARVT